MLTCPIGCSQRHCVTIVPQPHPLWILGTRTCLNGSSAHTGKWFKFDLQARVSLYDIKVCTNVKKTKMCPHNFLTQGYHHMFLKNLLIGCKISSIQFCGIREKQIKAAAIYNILIVMILFQFCDTDINDNFHIHAVSVYNGRSTNLPPLYKKEKQE